MATQAAIVEEQTLRLEPICTFPHMRALAWHGDVLYASRGYTLYSAQMNSPRIVWRKLARHRPQWWRKITSHSSLGARLVRDGFHALTVLPNGNLIAAVPGAIVTLRNGEDEFQVTHRIERGTRPLHICATPAGYVFWGEYFDNEKRSEVHIYGSSDGGWSWQIVHTFAAAQIRHVHNIVHDTWRNCLWILTGDYGRECRILRASLDFSRIDEVLGGNQQTRAVAAVPAPKGLYFASDTPLGKNHIYRLDPGGNTQQLREIPSSSIDGCCNRAGMFFSTMVEPSTVNLTQSAATFGSVDGRHWREIARWQKDRWSMRLFQYGAPLFPSGNNSTDLLAISTIALTKSADVLTTIYRANVWSHFV